MKIANIFTKAAVLASLLFFGLAQAAVIKTDVIFIVDESGSMGTVQTNLRNNIGLFAQILNDGGVEGAFGLVGYGNGSVVPRTLTDLTDPASFAAAAVSLVASGGTEPAYDAIEYAFNSPTAYGAGGTFSFRNDAVTNIILLTDEQHNGSSTLWSDADNIIKANNALFNLVSNSSANTTVNGGNLASLATGNGGGVFNLSLFNTNDQAVVAQFVADFADVKLQETLDFCAANPNDPACTSVPSVPEPKGLAALALLLLAARRYASRQRKEI